MRHVVYTDKHGYKRRVLLRDTDTDESAGIPAGPPDLDLLDCEAMKKEINNRFVDEGIFTWDDVQRNPNGMSIAISVVKRYIRAAFNDQARANKSVKVP